MRIAAAEAEVVLGPNDEESQRQVQAIEALEIDVAAIHHDERTRLGPHDIEEIDIVKQGLGNGDKYWNGTVNLEQGVKFDAAFGPAELGPGKERETKIDGGGVERISRGVEFQAEVGADIQRSGDLNQTLSEVGINSPVAGLVGVGQRGPLAGTMEATMIELAALRLQTDFDVA